MEQRAELILNQIKDSCLHIFGEKLTGIYVHGSLAFGCFHWENSDIDFIIVTKKEPEMQQKEQLIRELLRIDEGCPQKGLEMSVVTEEQTRHFQYPTPFSLHFSNTHKQACMENLKGYCERMQGTDEDLAAHFTVIREVGIVLYGKPIPEVFGEVPAAAYLDSIQKDIADAAGEICRDPVYLTLNLCRVLACKKEGKILSKQTGGEWAIQTLPALYRKTVEAALNRYTQKEDSIQSVTPDQLTAFAAYMLTQINP